LRNDWPYHKNTTENSLEAKESVSHRRNSSSPSLSMIQNLCHILLFSKQSNITKTQSTALSYFHSEGIPDQTVAIHRISFKLTKKELILHTKEAVEFMELLGIEKNISRGKEFIILNPANGHDIIGASLCLEPVASELLHSEESSVQLASLSLINQLLLNSPNPVAKIRIHHELKGK
uniref:Uncharacterized protein n=1 Tax=Parascaris equorum TaxID=6256 RepID=A0A914RA95_PAREQ